MRSFRSDDDEILVTICGHLFHKKCLDVSFTHQKLSHATSGTGPFRYRTLLCVHLCICALLCILH